MRISRINAAEVLDSRGNPTVEASVVLEDGTTASALVPSGASTGEKEAMELRDGDGSRYGGKGVLRAVSNINDKIGPAIAGTVVTEQRLIDQLMLELDGTPNKSNLGRQCHPGCVVSGRAGRCQHAWYSLVPLSWRQQRVAASSALHECH